MRLSLLNHPLAILRRIIGLTQSDLAELVGRRPPTIQAVESRKLQLSRGLAEKITYATRVSFDWLMAGDPDAPAVSMDGEPYTRAHFVQAQARKHYYEHVHLDLQMHDELTAMVRICEILRCANAKNRYHIAKYLLRELMDELAKQFAVQPQVSVDLFSAKTLLQDHLRQIQLTANRGKRARRNTRSSESLPSPPPA